MTCYCSHLWLGLLGNRLGDGSLKDSHHFKTWKFGFFFLIWKGLTVYVKVVQFLTSGGGGGGGGGLRGGERERKGRKEGAVACITLYILLSFLLHSDPCVDSMPSVRPGSFLFVCQWC